MNREIKLVNKDLHKLPDVLSFACSTEGAIANFTRKFGKEEIVVTLDVNSAIPTDMMGEEGEEDDEVKKKKNFLHN